MDYAVACSSSHAFCPENFKFARFWEGAQHFPGGPLANFNGNLTCDFQEDGGPDPLPLF